MRVHNNHSTLAMLISSTFTCSNIGQPSSFLSREHSLQRLLPYHHRSTRIRVHFLRLAETFPHLGQEDLHLFVLPSENPRQKSHRPTLDALIRLQQMPPSNLLQLCVSRPRSERHLESALRRVLEPSRIDQFLLQLPDAERPAHLLAGFDVKRRCSGKDVACRDRVVVTAPAHGVLHLLEPTTWFQMSQDLGV